MAFFVSIITEISNQLEKQFQINFLSIDKLINRLISNSFNFSVYGLKDKSNCELIETELDSKCMSGQGVKGFRVSKFLLRADRLNCKSMFEGNKALLL